MLPVSVVIPCYNGAQTLERTLKSCLAQPEATQIIVVDDGSVDESVKIARDFRVRDPRVELLPMPMNGGAARARNWGAMHVRESVIAFIDADDEYLQAALAAATSFLERNPSRASVRLDVEFIGFPDDIVTHPDFERLSDALSDTVPSSLVIRRQAYAALGGFPIDDFFRRSGGEDGAFSLALYKTFGHDRLKDVKRVRMHYHADIHAERFFRICMRLQAPCAEQIEEAQRLSYLFMHRAIEDMELLRAFDKPTSI